MENSKLDFMFDIPQENYDILKEKIDKLSDKNEKIGLPRIFMMPIGFKDTRGAGNYVHRVWEVMISGEVPTIDGWEFIAKVDFARESGNVIYASPNKIVPDIYHSIDSVCDHCNHTRKRNTGYVISKDGEYKIVGSSCINKFFNTITPEKLAKYYETIRIITKTCGEYTNVSYEQTYEYSISVKEFVMAVLETIEKNGWYGATQAKEKNEYYKSTASIATYAYEINMIDKKYEIEAQTIIDWAATLTDDEVAGNNFMSNIRVIAKDGISKKTDTNLIAGMVRAYQNKFNKTQKMDFTKSIHIGKVGDKISIDLTVYRVFVPSDGGKTIVKLIDEVGNLFTWFNHGSAILTKDVKYRVTGKIVAHNTFNNIKETILTRVKAEKLT